jgi:hypothetical protein
MVLDVVRIETIYVRENCQWNQTLRSIFTRFHSFRLSFSPFESNDLESWYRREAFCHLSTVKILPVLSIKIPCR